MSGQVKFPYASGVTIDWGDAPAWGALAVSLGALWIATRSRRAADRSADASEDSAQSARRSADAGERSADAAERSHQLAEQQYQDSIPPPVKWEIRSIRRHRFQLVNVGTDTATGVKVDRERLVGVLVTGAEPPESATIRPEGGATFHLAPSFDHQLPNEVWVTWDGQPEAVPVALPQY